MLEASVLIGLPGNIAIWRLLSLKGIHMALQALEETLLWDFSLDGMITELRSRGFEARTVHVGVHEVGHLQLPTLLQLVNGNWLLLRWAEPGGYAVEQGLSGIEFVKYEMLESMLAGPAIDLEDPIPDVGGLWTRMLKTLPRYRKEIIHAGIASLLFQGVALVTPWLTGRAIDQALPTGAVGHLQMICIGVILCALFRAWISWLRETTILAFSIKFEAVAEKGLFSHLLNLPFQYLQGKSLGELLQAFSGLGQARVQLLSQGLGIALSGVTAVFYLVYMLMIMPGATAIVVCVSLVTGCLVIIFGRLQAKEQRLEVKARQEQNSALVELVSGASTLKATASHDWALRRWSERLGRSLKHSLRRGRLSLWESTSGEILSQGLSMMILVWGGYKVLAGETTLGQLMVFSQLSSSFGGTLVSFFRTIVSFQVLRPQLEMVQEIFSMERDPKPPRKGPKELGGPILLEDIWFRYSPRSPWVLQAVHLKVNPGDFHHVKGASGSGKSTLLKVIAGLYAPNNGSVSVGGLDPYAASSLITFLPQFPALHSGSILDNLKIFSGNASVEHLRDVSQDTGLDTWIRGLPMGYETRVSSGASNLSGGQKQMIVITAILASSKKLLLLDEAMSNMDWVTRSRILRSKYFQGRTILYASHEEIFSGK